MPWSKSRTILCLFSTVIASMVAAVVGLYAVRLTIPLATLQANNDVAGNYLQTLGTVYGVLLAFVVFVVWSQKNEADRVIEKEADGLRDIVRLARALGGPVRLQILAAIDAYATAVIEREWPAMQQRSSSPEASQRLSDLWEIVEVIEPQRLREQCLYAETIRSINVLGDARADRLVNSGTRLPISLRLFVVAGGICTVGSMYFFGLEQFWPLVVMTAVMAGAVSHILYLIHDLDTPYGDWQVTSGAIERVREKVRRELTEARAIAGDHAG
jgi:hypothetical protein